MNVAESTLHDTGTVFSRFELFKKCVLTGGQVSFISTNRWVLTRVSDGARTRDIWNHNPALYQLSYTHRVWADFRAASERRQLAISGELQDVRNLKCQR